MASDDGVHKKEVYHSRDNSWGSGSPSPSSKTAGIFRKQSRDRSNSGIGTGVANINKREHSNENRQIQMSSEAEHRLNHNELKVSDGSSRLENKYLAEGSVLTNH